MDSFALVFGRISPALYAHALAIIGETTAAEDVVQDAFVRVWRRRSRLKDLARLDGYLHTAVRNLALDHRRRGKRALASQILVATPAHRHAPSGPDVERIDAALQRLPVEQREVVVLRVHLGLSYEEVAKRTGAPLGTVHSRYRYAMTHLRESLGSLAPGREGRDAC